MKHDDLTTPRRYLVDHTPDAPVLFFSPERLNRSAKQFLTDFPGLTTYAVKANPDPVVLDNLVAAGITTFDVASPAEMSAARAAHPGAVLHYNNPVRSRAEIEAARLHGIASASVDDIPGLEAVAPLGCEVAIRFKLPVRGAAYDFGEKFGATPDEAVTLLRHAAGLNLPLAMTFHPGTQCIDPAAWGAYIHEAARIAARAGVRLSRLNVGGGFPAHRAGQAPDLAPIFAHIARATIDAFGPDAPGLVCEPGRAMVAEAFCLATRVKALRRGPAVVLNDGIYGGLSEQRDIGPTDRLRIFSPAGDPRTSAPQPRIVYGPTCDSLDRLPDPVALPADLSEGDYLIFDGMGAYSLSIATRFNGYGLGRPVSVASL